MTLEYLTISIIYSVIIKSSCKITFPLSIIFILKSQIVLVSFNCHALRFRTRPTIPSNRLVAAVICIFQVVQTVAVDEIRNDSLVAEQRCQFVAERHTLHQFDDRRNRLLHFRGDHGLRLQEILRQILDHFVSQFHANAVVGEILLFALADELIENRFGPNDFIWIRPTDDQRLWNAVSNGGRLVSISILNPDYSPQFVVDQIAEHSFVANIQHRHAARFPAVHADPHQMDLHGHNFGIRCGPLRQSQLILEQIIFGRVRIRLHGGSQCVHD